MTDTTQSLDPEEVVDLTLQLLVESGYYDARVIRSYGQLSLAVRAIMASVLLREMPIMQRSEVMRRFTEIEEAT